MKRIASQNIYNPVRVCHGVRYNSFREFLVRSKYKKSSGFLMFSGGIERDQWYKMG